MKWTTLSKEEYQAFVGDHAQADFLNSTLAGDKFIIDGWQVHYVGIIDSGKVIAGAMIAGYPIRGFGYYYYAPRGFVMDYKDEEAVRMMTDNVRDYLKKHHGLYLKINPNVEYQDHDKDGNIVGSFVNDDILRLLNSNGYIHQGLTKGYDLGDQCRWVSVIDLKDRTQDEIFKSFAGQTRNDIKTAEKYAVKVRELKKDELGILYDMEERSGEYHHFRTRSLSYFNEMYAVYGDHVKALYAYLDIDEYHKRLLEEKKREERKISALNEDLLKTPNSAKKQRLLKAAREYYDALVRKVADFDDLQREFGKELPLASAMFMKYGKEVTYLFSGSEHKYRVYRGSYAIQWHMIKEAISEGYERYNMYGISGNFKKGEDGYGVFDFKRGFDAKVVELLGDFILVIDPLKYRVYKRLKDIKRSLGH